MPTGAAAFVPSPGLSVKRRKELFSGKRIARRRPQAARSARACAPSQRATDARGFVLPEEGDVVLYQGRWANEDAAGIVSSVRYVESREAHVVDIVELQRVSSNLFAVPGAMARRGKPAQWMDVAEVRLVKDATYVASQDAYRVSGTRDGYAKVEPLDEAARLAAEEEYRILKLGLLRDTVLSGAVGTAAGAIIDGLNAAGAFAAGAIASTVYLAMLQVGVDAVGKSGIWARLLGLRIFVPVLPFVAVAAANGAFVEGSEGLLGSLSKVDALAIVLGLLTYKVPLLLRTGEEFVDGLADFEMGKTGMVGTAVGLAAREIKKRRDAPLATDGTGPRDSEQRKTVIVFAGPSGVGKSTLIQALMDEYPGRFSFSVSHTTREKREGEVNGVDYNFVSTDEFERMIKAEKFVEYAQVHGWYYGTSYESVSNVLSSGGTCVLDLDVQGIETLRKSENLDWDARFVWVAPPSVDALRERLVSRGTETEETLKARIDTATRELAYAATNNVFDLIVVNDRFDDAYEELKDFINGAAPLSHP